MTMEINRVKKISILVNKSADSVNPDTMFKCEPKDLIQDLRDAMNKILTKYASKTQLKEINCTMQLFIDSEIITNLLTEE